MERLRNRVPCSECDKSYKDRRRLKRHLKGAHNMRFIPGSSLTRVLEGRELDEARVQFQHQQRNGMVRRRERKTGEAAPESKHVSSPSYGPIRVITPLLVIEPEEQEPREAVRSAGRVSCSGTDLGPRASLSMPALTPESPRNFSAAQWDVNQMLSISLSELNACIYDLDDPGLEWVTLHYYVGRVPSSLSSSPPPPVLSLKCPLPRRSVRMYCSRANLQCREFL